MRKKEIFFLKSLFHKVIIINLNIKEESKKERNTKLFSKKHHNEIKNFQREKLVYLI